MHHQCQFVTLTTEFTDSVGDRRPVSQRQDRGLGFCCRARGSKEPDGSIMKELDACHGHVISNGVYHYHGTTNYPYVVGSMKGKVTLDPTTTAPENQIIPQAFASPLRPATTPLSGAVITAFASTGTNAYKLTYQIGSKFGYVEYNWDASNKYTYKLTDVSGAVSTTTYQRK